MELKHDKDGLLKNPSFLAFNRTSMELKRDIDEVGVVAIKSTFNRTSMELKRIRRDDAFRCVLNF